MSANEIQYGVRLTADGRQLIGEVKLSKDALDGMSAAEKNAQAQALQFNTAHGAMAQQMNAVSASIANNARETLRYDEQIKSLRASLDPAYRATKNLEEGTQLLNQGYVRGLISQNEYKDSLSRLEKQQVQANDATAKGSTTIMDMLKAVGLITAAYKAWDLVKSSTMEYARYQELGVVMKVVGNNIGYTSTQMQQAEDQTRHMGITMLESRNTVVTLAQAHINLSDSSRLARMAQDAAVIGMTNSSEALKTMIYGIQSGQTDVLRTIGINVNFEQSYAKLAAQLKKTTADLTEHEKMQARENAVLEQGTTISGAYEASMGTAGKQIRSTTRYIEDMKVKAGETFNEALTIGVMGFTSGLKEANSEMDKMVKDHSIQTWSDDTVSTLAFVGDAVNTLIYPVKLMGKSLGGLVAESKAIANGDFKGAFNALVEMGRDIVNTPIIDTRLNDALDKRRAALAEDSNKKLSIVNNYESQALAIQKAYSGYSLEVQQQAQIALAESTGLEYSGKFKAIQEVTQLTAEEMKKRDVLVKAQDDTARRQLLGEKEYAISVIKDKYAEEIKLMQGLPDAEKRINELRKQMDAEITDIQINGVKAVTAATTAAAAQQVATSHSAASAQIADANAVRDAKIAAAQAALNIAANAPVGANVNQDGTVTMNAGTPAEFVSSWDAAGNYIGQGGTPTAKAKSISGSLGGGGYSAESLQSMLKSNGLPIDIGTRLQGYAQGGVFTNSIVDSVTPFKFANGGAFSAGVMGEKGPEAVMPLTRGPDGYLGVRAQGGGSITIQNVNLPGIQDARQFVEQLKQMLRTDPNLLTVGTRAG